MKRLAEGTFYEDSELPEENSCLNLVGGIPLEHRSAGRRTLVYFLVRALATERIALRGGKAIHRR